MRVVKVGLGVYLMVILGACGTLPRLGGGGSDPATEALAPLPDGTVRPVARPEEGAEARSETGAVASGPLGATVASLGDPSEQGLWLKTPLVSATARGRVTYKGRSQEMTLIPIEGEASAGSRISLAAMQALGIPLTELAEVKVEAL